MEIIPERRSHDQSRSGIRYSSILPDEMEKKQPDATVTPMSPGQTHLPRFNTWPEEARPLKQPDWIWYFERTADILLVLVPLYFILLGAAVIALHGKPIELHDFGEKVEAAIEFGPTIFPIMFAAICGRSLKMIGRYKAEKGVKLGTLELLLSSDSVWRAIEGQFSMGRLTVVGALLVTLWSLSPLGGQASLRLMSHDKAWTVDTEKWWYMSTGPGATDYGVQSALEFDFRSASPLYATALLAPHHMKIAPTDTWGHVKIPYLEKSANDTWVHVNATKPEDYVSLVGIPVARPGSSYSNLLLHFPLETSYLDLQCSKFKQFGPLRANGTAHNRENRYDFTLLSSLFPGETWPSITNRSNPFDEKNGDYSLFFQTDLPLWPYFGAEQVLDFPGSRWDSYFGFHNESAFEKLNSSFSSPRTITVISRMNVDARDTYVINTINCTLTQQHIEAWVECRRGSESCRVMRVKRSEKDNRSSFFTAFEHEAMGQDLLRRLPQALPAVFSSSTKTEQFLFDSKEFPPDYDEAEQRFDVGQVNISTVSPEVFSRRLTTILNTFMQVVIAPRAYTVTLPQNHSVFGKDALPASDIDRYLPSNVSITNTTYREWYETAHRNLANGSSSRPFIGVGTTATLTSRKDIYKCNFAWLAVLYGISVVIWIIGAWSLVLKHKTVAPDLFGYVASMTYENPYLRLPRGGSTLDAMERARMMQDIQVHVGDVRGDEEVGHVALAAGIPTRKLERGRLYM